MAPNADQLHRLAQNVGQACGMDITCTKDCKVLSDQLSTFDSRYPVSVSTLRRFFGLVANQGKFSRTTLNTMETRALNIWYQAARAYFTPEESELAVAEFHHAGMLTGYKGFVKRISMDLMGPIYTDQNKKRPT